MLLAFHRDFPPAESARLRRMLASSRLVATAGSGPTDWELQLRQEFLARFGAPRLPLPSSLEDSPLFLALRLSPRYMEPGFRDAAEALFSSPAFLASVTLAIVVYLAAWAFPEPLFSKAFAASVTVGLALAVGVTELLHLGRACLRLYREAEAARSSQELEAAAEHFGRSLGGTALRVLVMVASFGVAKALPMVPGGGAGSLLAAPRYVVAEGLAVNVGASVQVVVNGTLVVTGASLGALASSSQGAGSGTAVSTQYGGAHTRKNPPHNETIETELARREAAGNRDLRKNQPQVDAHGAKVKDPNAGGGAGFRKPDASSLRPDGIRHNTNYVSNARDLRREVEAFDAMVRADPWAIQELYLLEGTLVRRYVPPGVSFP
ncbi:hypothetical protein [Pyxidicoccus xibeiensis]|uniref:hypothetical protein n=1 Tax=Pyxidicoccus xibeiensis TaxID=2906759 RepID=UPI0020A70CDC|nr:hypothetical protein [Pyxidicoccus xibeiensis]MCP3141663.1 hypothetical protein [Pyxidicoccus xibeiensis]